MLSRLKQIAVAVSSLETSKRFYGEQLGMHMAFEVPGQLVFYDMDGVWLMLSAANEKEPAQPGSVLYFEVADIESAYRQLESRGVTFVDKPHKIADMGSYELWMSFFRDPDNTLLAIRSEVAK